MKKDILPTVADYANFLQMAVVKFNIKIDEARNLYGLFTYKQWHELLTK